MGRKLYISDTHFGHEKVIGFDNRPFLNVDEMMIEYWNMKVREDDEVYIVGDFQFRANKGPVWYLKRLNGSKFLILGNHDSGTVKSQEALDYFEGADKMMIVNDNGRQVHLCLFPMTEWHAYFRGSYHIYGHLHNRLNDTCLIMRNRKNAYNAAACINNFRPCTLDEIIENNKRFVGQNPLTWATLAPVNQR